MGSCSDKGAPRSRVRSRVKVGMEVGSGEKIGEPWGFIFFLGSMGELLI